MDSGEETSPCETTSEDVLVKMMKSTGHPVLEKQRSMDLLLEKLRGEMTQLGHQGDAYTQEILNMYATFEGLMGKPNESRKTDNLSLLSVSEEEDDEQDNNGEAVVKGILSQRLVDKRSRVRQSEDNLDNNSRRQLESPFVSSSSLSTSVSPSKTTASQSSSQLQSCHPQIPASTTQGNHHPWSTCSGSLASTSTSEKARQYLQTTQDYNECTPETTTTTDKHRGKNSEGHLLSIACDSIQERKEFFESRTPDNNNDRKEVVYNNHPKNKLFSSVKTSFQPLEVIKTDDRGTTSANNSSNPKSSTSVNNQRVEAAPQPAPRVSRKKIAVSSSVMMTTTTAGATTSSAGDQSDSGSCSSVSNSLQEAMIHSSVTSSDSRYSESEESDEQQQHHQKLQQQVSSSLLDNHSQVYGRMRRRIKGSKGRFLRKASGHLSSSDGDSIAYVGSNSIDSGYKSFCATPEVVSDSSVNSDSLRMKGIKVSALANAVNHPQKSSHPLPDDVYGHQKPSSGGMFAAKVANRLKSQQTDAHLEHLLHVRQSIISAIQRVGSASSSPAPGLSSMVSYSRGTSPVVSSTSRSTSPALTIISKSSYASTVGIQGNHHLHLNHPESKFASHAFAATNPTNNSCNASPGPKSLISTRNDSVVTPTRRLLPSCPPVALNRVAASSPSCRSSTITTSLSCQSSSSPRILPHLASTQAYRTSSVDSQDGKVTLSPTNKSVRFDKDIQVTSIADLIAAAGILDDKSKADALHSFDSSSYTGYSSKPMAEQSSSSQYSSSNRIVPGSRSILRDPLLESMRSHVRAGDSSNETAAGIEDEIDTLLYGRRDNDDDPEDSYHPVTDIIPCLEVPYVSMIEDRYRSCNQLLHSPSSHDSLMKQHFDSHISSHHRESVNRSPSMFLPSHASHTSHAMSSGMTNSLASSSIMMMPSSFPSSSGMINMTNKTFRGPASSTSVSSSDCFPTTTHYGDQSATVSGHHSLESSSLSHAKCSLEQFHDDSLDSVERLMMEDIADSMGLTSLTELTEKEARAVLREKIEKHTETETSPEDSTPPSSSETMSSDEASRDFASGMMMMVLHDDSRRGSSSTETSEDRQTTDSLSSSPHISAILEKHLNRRRRKSIEDAMSQSSSCQSYMTLPELHIYEEVYGDANAINHASYLGRQVVDYSSTANNSGLPSYYSRRLQQRSMETANSSARQRSNIYSLMKESSSSGRQPDLEANLSSNNPLESRRRPFLYDSGYAFEASV